MGICTTTFKGEIRLDGKTVIVTGSNTGIGKCTVQDLYKRGARVIMACRTPEKAEEAAADIIKACEGEENLGTIVIVKLDLTSLESVRNCANEILENEERVDILINNAGIMACPQSTTKDGIEMQFGVNHLGHFLFTLLLLPKIIKSAPARIINVSSSAHTYYKGPLRLDDINWESRSYTPIQAYCQSKLANILFTKELTKRIQDANIEGVTTYSLHPGVIATDIGRNLDTTYSKTASWMYHNVFQLFVKSPEQGAQTTIYCALDEKAGKETGLYYSDCKSTNSSSASKNMEEAKNLWDASLKMVQLEENYNPFISQ